ncbi:hypothetical protein DM860_003422 [Cuscuta australis]|uniref:Acyl-[acyl-carrier-protein] hydrolase n=1 Tax=Cuscuta australis TaxID=267555 RepID=A0A328DKV4_9ASTE|nr:hypothetical protein DM860_003422 [Cuscuta australis]
MVAAAAAAAFFPLGNLPNESGAQTSGKLGGTAPASLNARGMKSKSSASRNLQVKASAQAPPKVNGFKVGVVEGPRTEDELTSSSHPRTFINQLPDWSMLLAAITTIFLAAEKQWMMLDWKPKRSNELIDSFSWGRIVEEGLVFRQNFSIRSYEIGADKTASIETMMNHLQETALNHVKSAGLLGDGFGSTPEMCKKNLIWVVSRMQVLVDRYPTWGDVVQVDTWVAASGKNGMRRDWLIRDCNTGDILMRASSMGALQNRRTKHRAGAGAAGCGTGVWESDLVRTIDKERERDSAASQAPKSRFRFRLINVVGVMLSGVILTGDRRHSSVIIFSPLIPFLSVYFVSLNLSLVHSPCLSLSLSSSNFFLWVMMNKETRRLAKMPDEVRAEIGSHFVDTPPIIDEDSRKLPKLNDETADYIRSGLTPRWNDLDVNQHVNNVKYIGWILESAPLPILESHELAAMTLEYRRECRRDSVVQSLTSVMGNNVGDLAHSGSVECQHLLRLEGGAEIVKGRTEWRPKFANSFRTVGPLPSGSI